LTSPAICTMLGGAWFLHRLTTPERAEAGRPLRLSHYWRAYCRAVPCTRPPPRGARWEQRWLNRQNAGWMFREAAQSILTSPPQPAPPLAPTLRPTSRQGGRPYRSSPIRPASSGSAGPLFGGLRVAYQCASASLQKGSSSPLRGLEPHVPGLDVANSTRSSGKIDRDDRDDEHTDKRHYVHG